MARTRVVRIDGPAKQQDMVIRLEETLERVRDGKVRGLTIVTLHDDDEIWLSNHWVRWLDSIGALTWALAEAERGG